MKGTLIANKINNKVSDSYRSSGQISLIKFYFIMSNYINSDQQFMLLCNDDGIGG